MIDFCLLGSVAVSNGVVTGVLERLNERLSESSSFMLLNVSLELFSMCQEYLSDLTLARVLLGLFTDSESLSGF